MDDKRLKIGMIFDHEFPPEPRTENEAVQLLRAGFDVHLFCLTLNGRAEEEEFRGIRLHRYPFGRIAFQKLSPLAYSLPLYHQMLRKPLRHFLERVRPDILHIHEMVVAEPVLALNRIWNLPVVLDLHENRPAIMEAYSHVNTGPGKWLIRLDRWKKAQHDLIRASDRLIVVTEEAKKDVVRETAFPEDRIAVVPNSVDAEAFLSFPVDPEIIRRFRDRFVLLYLGVTGLRRGLETPIRALRTLRESIPHIRLVIVGQSRDDGILRARAEAEGVSDLVAFEGFQDVSRFPSYIRAAAVGLSPLLRNRHHDTTYANKLFQCMSLGCPLLVSDCPAQAGLVRETGCGRVHEAGNREDFAAKVLDFYRDDAGRKHMGEKGRKAVEDKYNWNTAAGPLIGLFRDLGDDIRNTGNGRSR